MMLMGDSNVCTRHSHEPWGVQSAPRVSCSLHHNDEGPGAWSWVLQALWSARKLLVMPKRESSPQDTASPSFRVGRDRLTWAITSLRMFHCLTLPKNDSRSPVEIRPLYNNSPPHICFSFVAVIKNWNYLLAFFFKMFFKWKFENNYRRKQSNTLPSCTHHPASTIANSGSVFFHLYLDSLPTPILIWGITSFHL